MYVYTYCIYCNIYIYVSIYSQNCSAAKKGFLPLFCRMNPDSRPQQNLEHSKSFGWQSSPGGSPSSPIAMMARICSFGNGSPEVAPAAP